MSNTLTFRRSLSHISKVTRACAYHINHIAMPLPCDITQTSNDYRLLFIFLEVTFVAWSSKEEQSNALYLNALNNRFCKKTRNVRALIVLAHAIPHTTFLARMSRLESNLSV